MNDDPELFDDDDDMFFNDDLKDREGVVSIWLNVCFEEENKVIGWYDHDYEEGGGLGRPQPVRQLLSSGSYWETWSEAAVRSAERLGISEARYVWMLFDHEYVAPAGRFDIATDAERFEDETPYYLGSFPYSRH
ncbi:hypothetical protein [Streptodolium elevatio]